MKGLQYLLTNPSGKPEINNTQLTKPTIQMGEGRGKWWRCGCKAGRKELTWTHQRSDTLHSALCNATGKWKDLHSTEKGTEFQGGSEMYQKSHSSEWNQISHPATGGHKAFVPTLALRRMNPRYCRDRRVCLEEPRGIIQHSLTAWVMFLNCKRQSHFVVGSLWELS